MEADDRAVDKTTTISSTATTTTTTTNATDGELSALLDCALADFGRMQNTDNEIDSLMESFDDEAVQKAANRFDQVLKQFNDAPNSSSSSTQQHDDSSASNQPTLDERKMAENFQNMIKVLIEAEQKNLNEESARQADEGFDRTSAENFIEQLKLKERFKSRNETDYAFSFQRVANRDPSSMMAESEFDTLMNLVQTFFAKDVMYPPLKQLLDKFPIYLSEHNELDAEQRIRYEKQISVLQRVCAEYEKDDSSDPEEIKKRFDTISSLMIELQSHGYPPAELVGDAPPGWKIDDESGLPKVDDISKAADACSLM